MTDSRRNSVSMTEMITPARWPHTLAAERDDWRGLEEPGQAGVPGGFYRSGATVQRDAQRLMGRPVGDSGCEPLRIRHDRRGGRVELGEFAGVERDVDGVEIVVQLRQPGRADERMSRRPVE